MLVQNSANSPPFLWHDGGSMAINNKSRHSKPSNIPAVPRASFNAVMGALQRRVKMLTEEIAKIRDANNEYSKRRSHRISEIQANDQRRERLEQILGELASLVSQERKAS